MPKHTTVGELKDLFSSGLGDQIESLYMIDKTHSAFVNYKTEGACLEALRKFQNLNFKGSRLVCRIKDSRSESEGTEHRNAGPSRSLASDGGVPEDRFFILKSLTVEDLSVSVGTGLWSTMPQNEPVLMDAFKVRLVGFTARSTLNIIGLEFEKRVLVLFGKPLRRILWLRSHGKRDFYR